MQGHTGLISRYEGVAISCAGGDPEVKKRPIRMILTVDLVLIVIRNVKRRYSIYTIVSIPPRAMI